MKSEGYFIESRFGSIQMTTSSKTKGHRRIYYHVRGPRSVIGASEFKSEDSGFDHLAGQGEGQLFVLSLRVNSSAHLFVSDPLFVCTAHTQICAQV